MKINAVLTGCALFKNREVAVFAFEPNGRNGFSAFRVLLGTRFHEYHVEPEWTAVGLGYAKYPNRADFVVVASSSEGDLWELTPGTQAEQSLKIAGDYSDITRLASFQDAIWACGMDRLVLKREENGSWTNVSAPPADVSEGVIGFTALAGVGTDEMIAVGWRGEIWMYGNSQWRAQDSGTNANFNAVSVGPDGQIVIVGDGGSVVSGQRDQWSVIDVGTNFNLQGVCHFGAEVFVSTDFDIYRFENGALVPETRFAAKDEPETCMNLIVSPESVFSQGEKDIFRYAQGIWTRIL